MNPDDLRRWDNVLAQADALADTVRAEVAAKAKRDDVDMQQLKAHLAPDYAAARAHIQQMLWRMDGR